LRRAAHLLTPAGRTTVFKAKKSICWMEASF